MTRGGDDAVITGAKAGEADAWRTLYAAHAGRLQVWLQALPTGDFAYSPDDLAAEAWLTAAERIADFAGDQDLFGGWLFGIARNHTQNLRRRARRRDTTPVEEMPSPRAEGSHADGADVPVVGDAWIGWALRFLGEREREVVASIDVVGLDVATTAAVLDMSPTAVRVARHRALKKLRGLEHQRSTA